MMRWHAEKSEVAAENVASPANHSQKNLNSFKEIMKL
jgi:hypothetical protein